MSQSRVLTIGEVIARGASHRAQRLTFAELKSLHTCTWDIESSNLDGDFGIMLCASIKPWGRPMKTFRLDEFTNKFWDDSALAEAVRDELEKFQVVIHHYGDRFDVPFLNTRLIGNHKRLLITSNMCFVDTWWQAKKRMKLHSNRLAALITHLDTKVTKTGLDGHLWTRAVAGDKEALDEVVRHNIHDVKALEQVTRRIVEVMNLRYTYLK